MKDTPVIETLCEEILGIRGRMISGSKSMYRRAYKDHLVVFNANVCTRNGKIWYGDLDITLDTERLQKLADTLDETIYVLYESDGRFEHELNPRIEDAVKQFSPIRDEKD
jgi:hypothetical protein